MKSFISVIALISSIDATLWNLPTTTIDCTVINCISTCNDYTDCPDPSTQSCIYEDTTASSGLCLETCGGFAGKQCLDTSNACIDNPLDDCSADKGGADCGGFCGSDVCGENEELQSCGSACPRKCGDPDAQICLAVCIPDVCRCKSGYILDAEFGTCIPEEECPKETEPATTEMCGTNEYYDGCGSACPEVCNDDPWKFCTLQCVPGCYCMDGYVLDVDGGECIPRGDCPAELPTTTQDMECGENEEYTFCGSACPATCTPTLGFIACPAVCVHGCFCKDGYVYNDNGECVLEEDCPTTATPTCEDENAEYTYCGSYCPGTCEDLLYHDTIACLTVCVEGCFCKDGYVFNDEGICIPEGDCPKDDISTTMTPSECDPECETDAGYVCVDDDGSGSAGCVMIGDECDDCYLSSFLPCDDCPDGINHYGTCGECTWQETWYGVKCLKSLSICPDDETTVTPICDENEEFTRCGTSCPRTCDTKDDLIACNFLCNIGCFCKDGYILDEEGGECIPEDECPMGSTEEPESTAEPECPVDRLTSGDKCDYDGRCCWGEETCCGKTYPSYCCSCFGGSAACLHPDSCLGSSILGCPSTTEGGEKTTEEGKTTADGPTTTDDDTDVTPCIGRLCGNDANTYGLAIVFGAIMIAFGWM